MGAFGIKMGEAATSAAGNFVGQVGGAVGDAVLGLFGADQRTKQAQMNRDAAELNEEFSKRMEERAYQRQREMYDISKKDQSYESRVKDMEAAGLNVGLLYGGTPTGGGMGVASTAPQGTTGGQQGGKAVSATERATAAAQIYGLEVQNKAVESQALLNEANAKKAEAEAKKIAGIDTDLGNKTLEEITENINNKKIQRAGMILQNSFDEIRNEIAEATKGEQIMMVTQTVTNLYRQGLKLEQEIDTATAQKIITQEQANNAKEKYNLEVKKLRADIAYTWALKATTEEQANKFRAEIERLQAQTDIDWKNIDVREREMNNALLVAGIHATGKVVSELIDMFTKLKTINIGENTIKKEIYDPKSKTKTTVTSSKKVR